MSAAPIQFTDNAVKKVHELIMEEGNPELKLRISITGGGCSGFQYDFMFETEQQEDDLVINRSYGDANVTFLVNPMVLHYFMDAVVDYKSDLSGEQFVISNPMAESTCGCGSSFSLKDEG